MKKVLIKETIYAFLMIIFITISYILINTGINTVTKININYEEKSNTHYEIRLFDNDIYDLNIKNTDWNILSNLIDDIRLYYNYKNTFSEKATGYYKYNVNISEVLYKDNEIISNKDYYESSENVSVIDSESIFVIDDSILIDYDNYKSKYEKIKDKYDINPEAKLLIKINIYEFLSFNKDNEDIPLENTITVEIPLSDEIVKIKTNNISNISKINQSSKKEDVNYFLIIIGLINLSLGLTFMIIVINLIKKIYQKEKSYKTKLKELLIKYDDKIINVKRLINIKKYNLIYVTSFKELLDVYNQYKIPICYKETIKNEESTFLIIKEENAWIYKFNKEQ